MPRTKRDDGDKAEPVTEAEATEEPTHRADTPDDEAATPDRSAMAGRENTGE